ncbi:MAG TPA: hypothetical protein DER01_20795 [Phycisphaerales bacterium]|nr:hypothetical protein [Phycisphaerales bacterium]|tara:strand:- start:311 stop:1330 length:1020 start_codon:yes stop_codon:yes gene_type:complete
MDAKQKARLKSKKGKSILRNQRARLASPKTWEYSDNFFKDVLRHAVPERTGEVNDLLKKHGINITPDNAENSMRFCVDLNTHEITISTGPLPRLWGHAYAYLQFYQCMDEAKRIDPLARSFPAGYGVFPQAIEILKWAMIGDAKARLKKEAGDLGPQEYPDGLSLPFDPSNKDPTHKVAGDLAMMALGYMMLHEIAHLELNHSAVTDEVSIEQEREADEWAAKFFLDNSCEYAKQHRHESLKVEQKRLLGLTIGFLWMLHFEVHMGVGNHQTHPPAYDRLPNVLNKLDFDGLDAAWSMAATILPMHYQARYGMVEEYGGFDDFPECYQHYADLLSKQPK